MSAQSSSHTSASTSSVAKPSSLTGDSKPLAVKAEDPIKFVAQSRSVHIYRPDQMSHQDVMASSQAVLSPISTTTTAPGVVVIMGWMDAPLRIVTKYAAPYAKLFPQATIVIKLSTGKSFMASKEAREASLMTVVKVLEEVNNKSNGLLLHSFSDGGAYNLSELLRLSAGRKVPLARAMIFDCSPGRSTPWTSSTALSLPLAKRPILRAIVRSLIFVYMGVLFVIKRIVGIKTWSQIMRSHLNNPQRWKAITAFKSKEKVVFPPRLYLYSKTDALINWKAVEEHAKEAAQMQGLPAALPVSKLVPTTTMRENEGAIVAYKRWEKANHCDLGRADFQGYWTAVRSFLEVVL